MSGEFLRHVLNEVSQKRRSRYLGQVVHRLRLPDPRGTYDQVRSRSVPIKMAFFNGLGKVAGTDCLRQALAPPTTGTVARSASPNFRAAIRVPLASRHSSPASRGERASAASTRSG